MKLSGNRDSSAGINGAEKSTGSQDKKTMIKVGESSPSSMTLAADGYTMLVTWPEFSGGRHVQETWYAHLGDQTEAVKAVQEACGALNDAKIEILGTMSRSDLLGNKVPEGGVRRAPGTLKGT